MYIQNILDKNTTKRILHLAGPLPSACENLLYETVESIRIVKPKYGLTVTRDAIGERIPNSIIFCSSAKLAGTEIVGFTSSDCPVEVLTRLLVKRVTSRVEIYSKRKREREDSDRKARREEKAAGRTHTRNFAFLEGILAKTGHNKTSMARASGMTPQNVLHYFTRDDASLSAVQKMLSGIGIELDVEFEGITERSPRDYELTWNGKRVTTWISGQPKVEARIRSKIEKPSRVSFFARLIKYEGYPISHFCSITGINNDRLRNILKTDDIRVSEIYRLGNVFGYKVLWKVKQL